MPRISADVPRPEVEHVLGCDLDEVLTGVQYDLGKHGQHLGDLASGHTPFAGRRVGSLEQLRRALRTHVGEQTDGAVAHQEVVVGQYEATQQQGSQPGDGIAADGLGRPSRLNRDGLGPAQSVRVLGSRVPPLLPAVPFVVRARTGLCGSVRPRTQFWFTGQTAAGLQWAGHASR